VSRRPTGDSPGGTARLVLLALDVAVAWFEAVVAVAWGEVWVAASVWANAGMASNAPPHTANTAVARSRWFMIGLHG
jgi:hypothetical protein